MFKSESISNIKSGTLFMAEERMNVRDSIEFSIMAWINIIISLADLFIKWSKSLCELKPL